MTQTTGASETAGVALERMSDRVYIVGFAPSWDETPWDDDAERWGLNALHRVADDKPWSRWFQLHDIDQSHQPGEDRDSHMEWLRGLEIPVYMWEEHIDKYNLPTAVPYPKEIILKEFGDYFTNSISWMMALALHEGFQKMGIYGVDMAQDQEYMHQRPSCEYFLGIAVGRGVDTYIPPSSDLLKSPFLYGADGWGDVFRTKMEARRKELYQRREQHAQTLKQANDALNQIGGAIENLEYTIRVWSHPRMKKEEEK